MMHDYSEDTQEIAIPRRRPRRPGQAVFAWVLALVIGVVALQGALSATFRASTLMFASLVGDAPAPERTASGELAPLFTAEIDHWSDEIVTWAAQHDLDPNLLATVMQIESCGHDGVSSPAGAQGLFQVMPFHFQPGETYTDPATNALRGANFLNECLGYADGDAGLAMACYNGGPGVLGWEMDEWAAETQRYYRWAREIYADAQENADSSPALQEWLTAGGSRLCDRAADWLGLDAEAS